MPYSFPFQSNKEAKITYEEFSAWVDIAKGDEMEVFWNNKLGNITQEESDLLMTANTPQAYRDIVGELKRRREMNQPREFKASGSLSGTPENIKSIFQATQDYVKAKGSGQTLIPSPKKAEVCDYRYWENAIADVISDTQPSMPKWGVRHVRRLSDKDLLEFYADTVDGDAELINEAENEILRRMKKSSTGEGY